MSEIDTLNKFGVGIQGDRVTILMPPRGPVPKADALLLAAYLVTMAEIVGGDCPPFSDVLSAIQKT